MDPQPNPHGIRMSCYSPLRGFKAKDGRWVSKRPSDCAPIKMNVACGQCFGCRHDRARHWAARIQHEAQQWNDNCFLTLTYEDEKMPRLFTGGPGTLVKAHFQKFMKRLRHHFKDTRIRYYGCGEYGDENERPHYHLCCFNLSFSDQELYRHNNGYPLFISETLNKLWGYGFATIGQLTYETAAYTSRYCLKKITGPLAHEHYLRVDDYGVCYWLEPEFTLMSRRPGIGREWIDQFQSDVYPSDEVPIPGSGTHKGVPRYYDKVLEKVDPKLYEEVKANRAQYAQQHPLEFSPQRLEAKYKCQKALKQHLKRNL